MAGRFEIVWTSVALTDLTQIVEFLGEDNPHQAVLWFKRIRRAVNTLRSSPQRCRVVPELQKQGVSTFRELVVVPYRVSFRIERNQVQIMGVLDGRRNLEDLLLERLVRDKAG